MPQPILVTGAHRSGTTWIGNIISSAQNVFYVQEPFNIGIKRKNSPCFYWFEHVEGKSHDEKIKFEKYLKSFYRLDREFLFEHLSEINTFKTFINFLKEYKKRSSNRPLFKDPIAIMSAEWFYKNLNCAIIVSIRHPAAFVASLKIKGWEFDFNNFLQQRSLMNSYLENFRPEIEDLSRDKYEIIDQGILLWNAIYSTVKKYQMKYENQWLFIKHEDLSYYPLQEFEEIFDFLDLQFDEGVKNWVKETSQSNTKSGFKRNSVENIKEWKSRLNKSEIEYIKEKTYPLWSNFYTEEDWL